MTEYEFATLFVDTLSYSGNTFVATISFMTGFVVIGLFFGQMLDRVMTSVLIAGYSFMMAIMAFQLNRSYSTFSNLAFEMRAHAAETGELQWHGVVKAPEFWLASAPLTIIALVVMGYIGTLVIFFRIKNLDPKEFR